MSIASMRLSSLAMSLPAMSKAVPWSTDVRMIGRPRVTLTPDSAFHAPVTGSTLKPRSFTGT
jgi:hypothetical protein